MPVPTPQQVTELAAEAVAAAGAELDEVRVTAAGRRSVVTVVVDNEAGLELDEVAELSRAISDALDAAVELGESPFTLQVTTPGTDRPLTSARHWRRARGRRASITLLGGEVVVARVGALEGDELTVVLPAKGGPDVRTLALGEVERAVVEVEFVAPDARELALTGAPGSGARPADPGAGPSTDTTTNPEEAS